MSKLRAIKEKLTWQLFAAVGVYIISILALVFFLLPAHKRVEELQKEVELLEEEEQLLVLIVAQRPSLELEEEELEENLQALAEEVPSQYDLPEVLDVISQLATRYGVTLDILDHIPLDITEAEENGVIPIILRVSGYQGVFPYLLQMQDSLPTLDITDVVVGYEGESKFYAAVQADLHVLVHENEAESRWEYPYLVRIDTDSLPAASFGLPFATVSKFLDDQIKVLGVVEAGNQSIVLLQRAGEKRWYKVGDRIDEAVVSSIFATGVWLYVDGVQLKLTVGS